MVTRSTIRKVRENPAAPAKASAPPIGFGEIMAELRAMGQLAKGIRGSKVRGARVDEKPALEDCGVDKNLAKAARNLAAMSEEQFEKSVAKARNGTARALSAAPVHLVEPPIRSERYAAELEPFGGKLTDRLRARGAEADLPCLARKRSRLREGLAGQDGDSGAAFRIAD